MGWIAKILGGLIFGLYKICFPDKTAAEQRADDREESVNDANAAIKTNETVGRESLADVESYLDKRVR